jgi:hypothetical protein
MNVYIHTYIHMFIIHMYNEYILIKLKKNSYDLFKLS